MSTRAEFKDSLKHMDRPTRMALLYLEKRVEDKLKDIRGYIPRPKVPVDLSPVTSQIRSLQNAVKDIKAEIAEVREFADQHDDHEKFLKKATKQLEEMAEIWAKNLKELYDSGYYSEGDRRRLRGSGVFKDIE